MTGPCGELLQSPGSDSWLAVHHAATTSRPAMGTSRASGEKDAKRGKSRTSPPWATPSRCPLQSGQTSPEGSLTKASIGLFVILKHHQNVLKKMKFHRNPWAAQPSPAQTCQHLTLTVSYSVLPSQVGDQQCPHHLWFNVYRLLPATTLSCSE